MAPKDNPPLPLQEALDLVRLPPVGGARRFMATRAAYLPGSDYPPEKEMPVMHTAAFGGHVYGQAALAVSRAWRELEDEKGTKPSDRLDLHTIHGYFTRVGLIDRPFLYAVNPLTASRNFSTLSVTASQPTQPSTAANPLHDRFPLADAALPLHPPAFAAICSFKSAEPDSVGVSTQEDPPQQRFADILSSRPPEDWAPAPPIDITALVELVGADQEGRFPVAVMRKVDMSGFNDGKPVHERRELLLYKLRAPAPPTDADGLDCAGGAWDANAHVAAHAFVADRNGLLMVGNHVGFGWSLGRAASLSYSFVMHVNAKDAVMRDEDGWWVQEAWFPRTAAGRGIVESKIWSPAGVHVATEYQDGLIQGMTGGAKL
ncbi:Thioesterase/thiol ester dehydrase-isomerase [Trichocladium antarcticum]|uniref:Thioesterase/thiol ester dehydrase-isomerase n=1 Tax=Trichocladium antarcticum TaxID=1450529 RepID=A0AAN6ZB73_9PEZI|nr:Thioesterase/thiol ester dehydrase-isomerase [Trichocladium antarcticum]